MQIGAFTWNFDPHIVRSLFEDFCNLDLIPALDAYKGSARIHFLRAGNNGAWYRHIYIYIYILYNI